MVSGIKRRKVIAQSREQAVVKREGPLIRFGAGWSRGHRGYDDLHSAFRCINGQAPPWPPCLQTLIVLPAHRGLLSTLPATHWNTGPQRRFQTGSHRRNSGKNAAEPGARWKGGATCTSSRASTVLLGNIVRCRESSLGLLEGGLQFPSVLGILCAARLRSLAANAAIKACFAPGLMLGSVVERPTRSSWSWGTGR